jgi:hypothetical protein
VVGGISAAESAAVDADFDDVGVVGHEDMVDVRACEIVLKAKRKKALDLFSSLTPLNFLSLIP